MTLDAIEASLRDVELRATQGEMPAADFTARMERVLEPFRIGTAVYEGRLSPVAHTRAFFLTNRFCMATSGAAALKTQDAIALVERAVTGAALPEEQRAALKLQLARLQATLDRALMDLQDSMMSSGVERLISLQPGLFDAIAAILRDVTSIGQVAATYQSLLDSAATEARVRH